MSPKQTFVFMQAFTQIVFKELDSLDRSTKSALSDVSDSMPQVSKTQIDVQECACYSVDQTDLQRQWNRVVQTVHGTKLGFVANSNHFQREHRDGAYEWPRLFQCDVKCHRHHSMTDAFEFLLPKHRKSLAKDARTDVARKTSDSTDPGLRHATHEVGLQWHFQWYLKQPTKPKSHPPRQHAGLYNGHDRPNDLNQ